jgi:hypothetical protein
MYLSNVNAHNAAKDSPHGTNAIALKVKLNPQSREPKISLR